MHIVHVTPTVSCFNLQTEPHHKVNTGIMSSSWTVFPPPASIWKRLMKVLGDISPEKLLWIRQSVSNNITPFWLGRWIIHWVSNTGEMKTQILFNDSNIRVPLLRPEWKKKTLMTLSDKLVSEAYFANFGNAPTCYEITYFSVRNQMLHWRLVKYVPRYD